MQLNSETKIIGGIVIASLVLLIGGAFLMSSKNQPETSVAPDQIVSQNGLHWHPKLTVTINGEKQEIPAGLGMAGQIHQELHTHDEDAKDGVVHMEMKGLVTNDETRLGNFFKIWGKEFSKNQIFDKKNGEGGKIRMKVNGSDSAEFENYMMKDNDKIEILYE